MRLAPRPPLLAGRDAILADLHWRLATAETLPYTVGVHGLGGVGKTSLVVEYGHRHLDEYQLVWQFPSEDPTTLSAAFADLAALLGVRQMADTADPVHQVHAALASRSDRWLLIFDNAPDADALRDFLPPAGAGHVLVTTRSGSWPHHYGVELPALDSESATTFLQQRSGQNDAITASRVVAELGALPLALEQAGAYLLGTGTGMSTYLDLLRQHRAALLAAGKPWGYDERVTSTWQLAFDQLAETSPQAIALLQLLACYAPESIPYHLLLAARDNALTEQPDSSRNASALLNLLPGDALAVNAAVTALRRYSLVSRPRDGLLSIHRLVQATTLNRPNASVHAARSAAAALIQAALPHAPNSPEVWPRYGQLLPHALAALPPGSAAFAEIAQYLGANGDYRTAQILCRLIWHHCTSTLGPEHPDSLAARHDLARWVGEAGNPATARDLLAALLPIRERILGADHPDTLATRHSFADWTGEAGDAVAARDQFARLLPIRERVGGAEHPDTLATRHNLARWTGHAGDPAAARDQYAALLPIIERVLGAETSDTLCTQYDLALWTGEAGDAVAARDQFTLLLPVVRRVLGAEHPSTLWTQHNLARWTGEVGDAPAACNQFSDLISVQERVMGADHPDTQSTRHNLAYWTARAR
ncbi:Tetratricopeptide repeat-containing protein [Nonomuraea solani]|uniref:Tetratricopeptide repeat-containing protein n=2 Tax=Nonomuraea solani TaxID=1144553 RepID=A0A1H6F3F3_9ACTN|nr:Tetratricopeptide repeat-containing protein [Nonomuraea solani]